MTAFENSLTLSGISSISLRICDRRYQNHSTRYIRAYCTPLSNHEVSKYTSWCYRCCRQSKKVAPRMTLACNRALEASSFLGRDNYFRNSRHFYIIQPTWRHEHDTISAIRNTRTTWRRNDEHPDAREMRNDERRCPKHLRQKIRHHQKPRRWSKR